jgi:mRNA interferase HicA
VNGREFIGRVRNIGRARGVPVRIDTKRGKGSHVIVYYARRKTIVKDRRKEISPGLLSAMLRQLGLRSDDLW